MPKNSNNWRIGGKNESIHLFKLKINFELLTESINNGFVFNPKRTKSNICVGGVCKKKKKKLRKRR